MGLGKLRGPALGPARTLGEIDMKSIYTLLIILFISMPLVLAQDQQSNNDTILRMKTALNLSDDQVTNITQIMDRYTIASNDLQKSIDDGTINPSAIDSQKQQIKAAEDQGIAQYLRPDQLSQWNNIQNQTDQQDNGSGDTNSEMGDEYLPSDNPHP